MELAFTLLALLAVVILVASACERFGLPAPLILTIVGLGASFLPFVHIELDSEVVLLWLLPPLLYAAAIQVSLIDFRSEIKPIGLLSVGLVVFTAFAVGGVTWWLLPVPFAAAFALGAIVGPPDAVAATAVGRAIGLPRRIVTMLEGESLVNDATAIVLLRTSTAAIVGAVTWQEIAGGFALSAIGGLVVGVAVGWLVGKVHHLLSDARANTALSLITPWLAYLPAEEIHGSGVLAVVIAGLIIAHRSPTQQTATSRLSQGINWATVQFVLENSVFLLIGLQVQQILLDVANSELSVGLIVGFCVLVLVVTILARMVWLVITRPIMRAPDRNGVPLSWRDEAVLGWAGMRGVVTLAAAFVLPAETPHREVLVLAALVVVAGTLLIQGFSLPWVARRLKVRGPDPRVDVLQEAKVMRWATQAGLRRLDELCAEPGADIDPDVITQVRRRVDRMQNVAWERLREHADQTPSPGESYRIVRTEMLEAERAKVLKLRQARAVDNVVLASVMNSFDLEEAMLDRIEERRQTLSQAPVQTPDNLRGQCAHLSDAEQHPDPEPTAEVCLECEREGTRPVHLRECLTCGNVACCDSSVGRHATRHFEQTGHPVMRSAEADEAWRWCYVDDQLG